MIFATFASFSGLPPLCVSGWCGFGDADLGIGAGAGLARQLERDDAGDVALQREHLQIEHQPRVVGVGGGHADRPIEIGQVRVGGLRFGLLDAALHLADGVEILADLGAVAGAELLLQAGDIVASPNRAGWRSCAARRGAPAALPPSPNRRSKTMRGCASAGSGVVGDDQERLFW